MTLQQPLLIKASFLSILMIEITSSFLEIGDLGKKDLENTIKMLYNLDKRVRSLEQPAWEAWRSDKRWSKCSEGPCRCSKETLTLACWRQNLGMIPRFQAIPYEIKIIDLSVNELRALHKNTFHDLSSLTDLDISYNELNFLPESIFESLSSLRNLKLRNNFLEEMSGGLLREQSQLEILDVSFNELSRLDGELLSFSRRLRAVNFAWNRLAELPASLFSGLIQLEELDLCGNGLRGLDPNAFGGLYNLTTVDISKNNLTFLPPGLFSDTKKLQVLSASSNYLSFIEPTLFSELTHLTFLDLTSNWISEFSGTSLEGSLEELHLGQNRLQRVPVLSDLPALKRLFLFSNQIRELSASAFRGFPNLRTLSLNHNLITRLEPQLFEPLKELTNLQLDSNKLTNIPEDCFKENLKLSGVKLTKNPWHCDCTIWNFSVWLKENKDQLWGLEPTCLGPGELGGRPIDEVSYEELCEKTYSYDEEEVQIEPLITNAKTVS